MSDFRNQRRYAYYRIFSVGNKASGYRLTIGEYEGNAGNMFSSSCTEFDFNVSISYDKDMRRPLKQIFFSKQVILKSFTSCEHMFLVNIETTLGNADGILEQGDVYFQVTLWGTTMDAPFLLETETLIHVLKGLKVVGGIKVVITQT